MPFINDKIAFPYLTESVAVRYYTYSGQIVAPVAGTSGSIKAASTIAVSKPQRMREVVFELERGGKVPELPVETKELPDEVITEYDVTVTTPTRDAGGSATYRAEGRVSFRLTVDRPYDLVFPKSQTYDPGQEPNPPA